MGTSHSTISQDLTICCDVLVFVLHHALTRWEGRLFTIVLDMSSGVLLGISSLGILMLCLTILLRSNNLTNLLMEGLISWPGGFEMC